MVKVDTIDESCFYLNDHNKEEVKEGDGGRWREMERIINVSIVCQNTKLTSVSLKLQDALVREMK